MRHVVLVGLPAIALVLAGCSASPTPTSLPTAEEVLTKARDAMSEVQSYRYRIDIVHDSDEGVQEARVTGEWTAPDRFRMRTEGLGSGAGHVQEVISVGGQVFTSDSDYKDGAWEEQRPRGSAQASSRPPSSLIAIPDGVELRALEKDTVSGVPIFHLTYTRKQETSPPTSSGADSQPVSRQYVILFDLFITTEDYRLLKTITEDKFISQVTTAEGSAESEDLVVTQRTSMEFYDYDQPVTIELPEPGVG